MSSSYRTFSSKKNTDTVRRLVNARIISISSIAKPVLATLAATLIVSGDSSLYTGSRPAPGAANHMSYDEASRAWFDGAKLSIAEQDDPSQVGAFIASAGVDVEHAEIVFDIDQETRFERNAKSMRVRAECIVEYDANQQTSETEAQTTVETGDSYAFNEYDCLDDDETLAARKRAKTDEQAAPPLKKPKLEKITISGTWPVLSPCIRLDIKFKTSPSTSKHELVEAFPYFDKSSATPTVTVGDFAMLLRHGAIIHPKHIETVISGMFPTLYPTGAPMSERLVAGTCSKTVALPPDWNAAASSKRKSKTEEPHPYVHTVSVDELLGAIRAGTCITLERTFNEHKAVFAGLAAMMLFPRAVALFVEHYGPKRWIDIVARGHVLVSRLYELMTHRPHILCFTQLKYAECVAAQQAFAEEARRRVRGTNAESESATSQAAQRRLTSEEIERQRDASMASMRWLAQMPELRVQNYVALSTAHAATLALPVAQRQTVRVAIDIFTSIIRHDLNAGDALFDDTRRNETRGRGATSGHVFSVFGNTYGQHVPSERYDSGYSDGTLCLDTFFAAWTAAENAKKAAAAAATTKVAAAAPVEKSTVAKRKLPENDEIEDFLPARLPSERPPVLQQQHIAASPTLAPAQHKPTNAAAQRQSTTTTTAPAAPEALSEDIARLSRVCTNFEFCSALRWLCEQSLLVSFKQIGTGPMNAGRPFDVFYTREMWHTQLALAETLSDIYRRALLERLVPRASAAPATSVASLNADIAFREQARMHLRAIVRREELRQADLKHLRQVLAIERRPVDDEHPSETQQRYQMQASTNVPLKQLRVLHSYVKEFIASTNTPAPASVDDAYADMLAPDARRLARDDDAAIEARMASTSLSEEQKDGIRHVRDNGITIFMSPGGCGKTFAVECITKCYSLDQIAVCALTGKAVEVLHKQVGKVSTIHSLLLRETLHRQTLKRHRERLARLRAALNSIAVNTLEPTVVEEQREFLRRQVELEELVGASATRSPLANIRVLIVDETSLIDEELIRRLLEFLHPLQRTAPGDAALMRVLFLGDFNQLGSIEPGSLLQSLCRAFPHCVRMFTRNFRSAGVSIFKLARGIVLRKRAVIDGVDFDMRRNEARLRRSPVASANATPEERAAAEDASIVFFTTNASSLQGDLRRVLGLLGAVVPAQRGVGADNDALITLRDGIHIISPTNALATTCNTYCREMYFGNEQSVVQGDETSSRYALPQAVMYFKLLRADRLYFKRNFKTFVEVDRAAFEEHAAAEAARKSSRETDVRRAALLALAATSDAQNTDAGADEDEAPTAVATEHGVLAVEMLDKRMALVDATLGDGLTRRVVTRFYNSEILTMCDFYDVPRHHSPTVMCICGLCPPPSMPRNSEEARALRNARPNTCVRWPHVVPERRQRVASAADTRLPYHDYSSSTSASAHSHRMAVFRTQTGAFKQLAVDVDMQDRSAWEYGWATTIHRYEGSGTRAIIIVIPRDTSFVDRSMLYTAVTRAEERVIFMGSADTWRRVAQREPALRRTELWFMLAQAVAHAHRVVAEAIGASPSAGDVVTDAGAELSSRLAPRSDTECELLDTRRRPTPADSGAVWAYFDRIYAETIQRAGLSEL